MSGTRVLTCEEAIRLLAAYLDDEIEPGGRGDLEHHLALCRSCFSRHEFERKLKEQLAALGREPVRPEFQARMRTLVGRFAARQDTRFPEDPDGRRHIR